MTHVYGYCAAVLLTGLLLATTVDAADPLPTGQLAHSDTSIHPAARRDGASAVTPALSVVDHKLLNTLSSPQKVIPATGRIAPAGSPDGYFEPSWDAGEPYHTWRGLQNQ